MKEEIKEILEALKPHDKEFTSIKEYPLTLSVKGQKILLDYITNLKEENERLKEVLKNNGVVKTCENCEWFGVCPHSYREYDYKQRNEKAIEYITSEETINMFSSINAREKWLKINHKLLNILKVKEKTKK